MEFLRSRPDVIRSINQRWLLNYWNRLRAGASVPLWQGLEAEELAGSLESLSFQDVVAGEGGPRFLIRFHGRRVAELSGRTNCVGKFLDEILPPAYAAVALATYEQAVKAKLPVYTIADVRDGGGRTVHYERLLLPFRLEGDAVSRILASLEAVSPEGAFERRALIQAGAKSPGFALCATISM